MSYDCRSGLPYNCYHLVAQASGVLLQEPAACSVLLASCATLVYIHAGIYMPLQLYMWCAQVIEMVMATDMKQHFSILSHFNTVHRLSAYSAAPTSESPMGGRHR